MASRFWVGGTGSWTDGASHWAASSGGAPAAANTPTLNDDVFFDANSFSVPGQTVTIDFFAMFRSMDWTGATNSPTFAGSAGGACYGSITFVAGMTASQSGSIRMMATSTGKTITTGGIALACSLNFFGIGGGWTLQDALTTTGAITLSNGSLDTNGKAVSCSTFSISDSTTRALTLGASVVTCTTWSAAGVDNLTFNAGTSTIVMTGPNTFAGGGLTYWNVSLTDTTQITYSNGTLVNTTSPSITGANTFRNLSRTNTSGYVGLRLDANQTVTGTLTLTGNNATTQRLYVGSDALGTARTITAPAVVLTNVDLEDVTGAGVATWSGTSVGNCGGLTGITPTPAVTRYWVHPAAASANWTDPNWSASSGGGTGATNPLPQDDVVFDASSFGAAGKTVVVDVPSLRVGKTVTFAAVTNAPTLNHATASTPLHFYGSWTFASGMTYSSTATSSLRPCGRGSFTFTTAGKSLPPVGLSAPGGTLTLQDAMTGNVTLSAGTLDTNGQTVSGTFSASNVTYTRVLTLGASNWNCNGAWTVNQPATFTLNAGTSTITLTAASTFTGGGKTYRNLTVTANVSVTIADANSWTNLTYAPAASQTAALTLSADQTVSGTFTATGGSAASNRSFVVSDAMGTVRTITAAVVVLTNVDLRDIAGAGAGTWSGTSVGDAGGNSGITFTPAVTRYWKAVSGGNWNATSSWAATSGGATGATVPLCHDTVIFDAASITSTGRTISANMPRLGKDIDISAVANNPALNLTQAATVFGNLTLGVMTSTSGASALGLSPRGADAILTSAGVTFNCPVTINTRPSRKVTLADALSIGSARLLTLTQGILDTAGKAVTVPNFSSSNANTRTLTLGATVFTLTGTGNVWTVATDTGLTLNAGTSKIVINDASSTGKTFAGSSGNLAYYDLQLTGAGTGAFQINGSQSWHDITIDTPPHTVNIQALQIQTLVSLTCVGTLANAITIQSLTAGSPTFVIATSGTISSDYVTATDLVALGGATFSFTHMTDGGRNYGLGTDSPRYWVAGGNGYYGDTSNWSASSGGASGASAPVYQDTYFDANSGSGAAIMSGIATGNGKHHSLDCTGFTGTLIWTGIVEVYGDLTLSPTMSVWAPSGNTAQTTFRAPVLHRVTSAGKSWASVSFNITGYANVQLQDDLNLPYTAIALTLGTLDANGHNVTADIVSVSGTGTRTLLMGSGTWTCLCTRKNGLSSWSVIAAAAPGVLTVTPSTSTILIQNDGLLQMTFAGGGQTYNNVRFGGTGTGGHLVTGSNTFSDLRIDGGRSVQFTAGTTQTLTTWTVNSAIGATTPVTLSSATAGSAWTVSKASGIAASDYLVLSDSTATGGATWYAGSHSTNGGGNTGWTFLSYLYFAVTAAAMTGSMSVVKQIGKVITTGAMTGSASLTFLNFAGAKQFLAVARTATFAAVARTLTFLGVSRR